MNMFPLMTLPLHYLFYKDPIFKVVFLYQLDGGDKRNISPVKHTLYAAALHAIGRIAYSFCYTLPLPFAVRGRNQAGMVKSMS